MKNTVRFEIGQAILSAIYIALGMMLVIFPGVSGLVICHVVGICALAFGTVRTFTALKKHSESSLRPDSVIGVLLLAFGIFALIHPEAILSILPFALGLYLLLESVGKFQRMVAMRRMGHPHWWAGLAFAVLMTGCGVLLLVNPFSAAKTMLAFLGISLVFDGVADLCTLWLAAGRTEKQDM